LLLNLLDLWANTQLQTVPYVPTLAASLPHWHVCHVQLSSAGRGWGMASLDDDCAEIELAVKWAKGFFKQDGEAGGEVNVVLIGHSTGCQDVLHYLHSAPEGREPIQGAILQAPVSDRDSLLDKVASDPEKKAIYDHCVKFAESLDEDEQNDMIIPLPWSEEIIGFNRTPVSVARFLSLASPDSPGKPRGDDLFSYDATAQRLDETFGKIGMSAAFAISKEGDARTKPSLLVGMMGADEYVPKSVDIDVLLLRWKKAIEKSGLAVLDENSGVVKGGKHNLRGKDGERREAREDFVRRVKAYLGRVVDTRDENLGPEERLPHRPAL
jgi:pimeloyl-ACP methyl ester carboxylesterase